MPELKRDTIKHLSKLCRIECTEEEEESLWRDLKNILSYIEQLQEVNTENVKPCNHVLEGMVNVMRDDVVGKTMSRDVFLNNAPSHVGGLIRVPPILKAQQ